MNESMNETRIETRNEHLGSVFLVGAGPGDPGLLTVKGKEVLSRADVVIYDRLIPEEVLSLAPSTCELIYVGKSPGKHYRRQEEINEVLVEKAREGSLVVRLKGGDPFVFGRGGEEALALKERGIAFEIIPGVTSAVAVPAYAGIPITHRGMASSFTVITGHEDPEKEESSIAWEQLSTTMGTLVFLMGMHNLALIAEKLSDNGMDDDTPVAVIEKGTSPEQRTVCGTLKTITSLAERQHLKNPAVIVVGQVVSLRDELQWFEHKPLFGERIMVTRARHQASRLSAALADLGASVLELPVIAFCPPSHPEQLSEAVRTLPYFNWLLFTSVNGVDAFFTELYSQALDVRHLAGLKLVAIGSATQSALESRGFRGVIIPEEYYAEGLVKEVGGQIASGDKVLLVRAEEARDILPAALAERGAQITEVAAYKTVPAEVDREALIAALQAGDFDAMTFTSSSTVHNLMHMIGKDAALLDEVKLFSIGPITSSTLRTYELEPTAEAECYCIEGLVQALVDHTTRR